MYCTSTQFRRLSESELVSIEQKGQIRLPQAYRDFMKTYGDGTYSGVICINCPDFELLDKYAEDDFWEYDGAPIRREQMKECVVIGNSIDGDYIAIHDDVDGYILLPRQEDRITLFPYSNEDFLCTVNRIGEFLYNEGLDDYFEPGVSKYMFMYCRGKKMHPIIERFKAAFPCDYLVENEYVCEVFLFRMGGYVSFRHSGGGGSEIVIYYSDYGMTYVEQVKRFLNENGCS